MAVAASAARRDSKEDASATGSNVTPLQREIMKLEKKIREVDKLQQRSDAGETLDVLQKEKISKRSELLKKLEELLERKTLEEAASTAAERPERRECDASAAPEETPDPELAPSGRRKFDAACFLGDWVDTLGQRIIVTAGRTRKSKRGSWVIYTYICSVFKPEARDKRLLITWDSEQQEWRCGNALLMRNESNPGDIRWLGSDGRKTTWTPSPPDCTIYFDPAPEDLQMEQSFWSGINESWESAEHQGMYAVNGHGWYASGTWCQSGEFGQIQADQSWSQWSELECAFGVGDSAGSAKCGGAYAQLGSVGTSVGGAPGLSADGGEQELQVYGCHLDWLVPDAWGKLKELGVDECVSSPVCDFVGCQNMQLEFYPKGKKNTDAGMATVQLVRDQQEQDGIKGIKFELKLNGRSSGPKACLGRRFLADYPRPFADGDAESHDERRILVSFIILSVF